MSPTRSLNFREDERFFACLDFLASTPASHIARRFRPKPVGVTSFSISSPTLASGLDAARVENRNLVVNGNNFFGTNQFSEQP